MDVNQQLKTLTDELQQALDEKECLREKYESMLEIHKNFLKQCRCKGGFKNYKLEEDALKPKSTELEAIVKNLKNQIALLEIQLTTYKEDFLLERKDREAAQDRVIRLEQELADLCSRGCKHRCADTNQPPREASDPHGFEIFPTSSDSVFAASIAPQPEDLGRTCSAFDPKDNGPENLMGSTTCTKKILRQIYERQDESEAKDFTAHPEIQYEYDGFNCEDAQLRGRMFKKPTSDEETFLFISKSPLKEEHLSKSLSQIMKGNSLMQSKTPPIIKVFSQGSGISNSPKTSNIFMNNAKNSEQHFNKDSKRDLDSNEILRCPACFQAFKASTEHYQLLQHLEFCGK